MNDPQRDATWNGTDRGADDAKPGAAFEDLFPVRAFFDQENRLRELIRAHPVSMTLAALALGFAAARWLREYR